MRWWGWGRDEHVPHLPPSAVVDRFLREALDMATGASSPPPSSRDVLARIPPSRLSDAALADLRAALAEPRFCSTHPLQRLIHACGKSYRDLIRLRSSHLPPSPDAVVCPGDEDEVARILAVAERHDFALVPFGGGTSVVGGVDALRGSHAAVVTVDLHRLSRIRSIDADSQVAEVEAGAFGPELEAALQARGWTLGHYPQSFEYSTVGGWVATRSAGQNSSGYGRIEDMLVGLRTLTPIGPFEPAAVPARATGPDLVQAMVGSEGTLGIITRATLRVHRAPESKLYGGFLLPSFAEGTDAARRLVQEGLPLALLRLSDNAETRMLMRLGSPAGRLRGALESLFLATRGFRRNRYALMLIGFEGGRAEVKASAARARRLLRRAGALDLGTKPGTKWLKGRFDLPYLRDVFLDRGVLVDTLETAALWSSLDGLYQAVGDGIRKGLEGKSLVACHVSHVYNEGASLYFTFLAPQQRGRELEQWDRVKRSATDAIFRAGGTLSHHHGVGADHRAWGDAEWGPVGLAASRALKAALDPKGVLNPEKLF